MSLLIIAWKIIFRINVKYVLLANNDSVHQKSSDLLRENLHISHKYVEGLSASIKMMKKRYESAHKINRDPKTSLLPEFYSSKMTNNNL